MTQLHTDTTTTTAIATTPDAAPRRAVLTIATGRRAYIDMAINLARSFLLWNRDSGIDFYLATDSTDPMPPDLDGIHVLRHAPGELGVGFSMKLKMDTLSRAQQTLFVDADCLCIGPLAPVFDRFAGRAVSVVGDPVQSGEWFGDIERTRGHFGLPAIPKFNGGVYYFEQGDAATRVFEQARSLEHRYDDLGLVRLRDCPNEEMLMSIAMALNGCEPLHDDGTIHGELFAAPILHHVDVVHGEAVLSNPPPSDPRHRPGYPVRVIHPVIVHFLGDFTRKWPYRAQVKTLALIGAGVPPALARGVVLATYAWPARVGQWSMDLLRPAYRRIFGVRAVRASDRV